MNQETTETKDAAPTEPAKETQSEKKPRKRQRKGGEGSMLGWYLEAYPLKPNSEGRTVPSYPPAVFELTKSHNLKQAMEQYRRLADASPDKVANCYCRILEVKKDFRTRMRQVVDIMA